MHHVWLLDLSYRTKRYERLFPELTDRMQTRRESYSFFNLNFWRQLVMDVCLVVYCVPEFHVRGITHVMYVKAIRLLHKIRVTWSCDGNKQKQHGEVGFNIKKVVNMVKGSIDSERLEALNASRMRAGLKKYESWKDEKHDLFTSYTKMAQKMLDKIKENVPEKKLEAMSLLPDIMNEVSSWQNLVTELRWNGSNLKDMRSDLTNQTLPAKQDRADSSCLVWPEKICLYQPVPAAASSFHEPLNETGGAKFDAKFQTQFSVAGVLGHTSMSVQLVLAAQGRGAAPFTHQHVLSHEVRLSLHILQQRT
jgi:hypothetical protein